MQTFRAKILHFILSFSVYFSKNFPNRSSLTSHPIFAFHRAVPASHSPALLYQHPAPTFLSKKDFSSSNPGDDHQVTEIQNFHQIWEGCCHCLLTKLYIFIWYFTNIFILYQPIYIWMMRLSISRYKLLLSSYITPHPNCH